MRQNVSFSTRTPPKGDSGVRLRQRGSAQMKTVFWLLGLVLAIYIGIKVLPVLFSAYEFEDSMKTTARFASVNRQTPEDIRKSMLVEATKDDLPIKPEDIKVSAKDGTVQIEANYSVTVDLEFYQWTLDFHPDVINNPI